MLNEFLSMLGKPTQPNSINLCKMYNLRQQRWASKGTSEDVLRKIKEAQQCCDNDCGMDGSVSMFRAIMGNPFLIVIYDFQHMAYKVLQIQTRTICALMCFFIILHPYSTAIYVPLKGICMNLVFQTSTL